MNHHDHIGPWWGIGFAIALVFVFTYTTFMVQGHQINVIYDRVGDIQRQLECAATETLVEDHDGEEYCVDVAERD